MAKNVRVGISIGDVNGIGPELIERAFADSRMMSNITPVIYGSAGVLNAHQEGLGVDKIAFTEINDARNLVQNKLNIVKLWSDDTSLKLGSSTKEGGECSFKSLEAATTDLASNRIDVLVTAPINKDNIQSEGFDFPGHTEYLAKLSNVENALMFMCSDNLRVGIVTGHIPINKVAQTLTQENILEKIIQMNSSLIQDFVINRPKIAVLGLNPHAGEKGLLGGEEKDIITPAIKRASEMGILAFGPYSADGFFGSTGFKNFDAVLAMYHDQGLIPFKALTFGRGVNYTAGLPIVRTSPDHGTAYDLVGKGTASLTSFQSAVFLARDVYLNRAFQKEVSLAPLK